MSKTVKISIAIGVALVALVGGYFLVKTKDYPVSINEIDLTEAPTSVVSLSPFITETLVAGGYQDKLIGVTDYCVIPGEVPRLGSGQSPDVGKIKELKPTLVLTQTPIPTPLQTQLENEGIIFIYMENPIKQEEVRQNYYDILSIFEGRNIGKKKLTELYSVYDAGIANIKKQIKTPETQTFAILGAGGIISTGDTVESELLSPILGKNVAGEAVEFSYTAEGLVESNPDILVVKKGQDLGNYQDLKAVQEGKVVEIDFVGFEQNNLTKILQDLDLVAKTIYPDTYDTIVITPETGAENPTPEGQPEATPEGESSPTPEEEKDLLDGLK